MTCKRQFGVWRMARVAVASLLLSAGAASGQAASTPVLKRARVDPRFQPWMGCWSPSTQSIGTGMGQVAKPPSMACVVPSTSVDGSVDIVVFDSVNVATRSAVPLPGTRIAKSVDGCAGTETSAWMPDDRRLLVQAELSCGRGARRLETGLMTMSAAGQWMQVQHLDVGGNSATSVITMSYVVDSLGAWASLGANASPSTLSLRLAVGAPLLNGEVLEVAKRAPIALTEAWLTETRQQFAVNGQELIRLANGGMPTRVLDLMIAISNPETFAVRTPISDRNRNRGTADDGMTTGFARSRAGGNCHQLDDFCYGLGGMGAWGLGWQNGLNGLDPYGLRYGLGGLYGLNGQFGPFGGGFFPGGNPIIIVYRGGDSAPRNVGRAVRGGGYTRDASAGSSSPVPSAYGGSSSSGGGSVGGSSGGSSGSTSGGSTGGDTGRTAKPRGGGI